MEIKFLTAKEVSELMKCSKSKAYSIIKELNVDLEKDGIKVSNGRINEAVFAKAYGFTSEIKIKQEQE
ncbi:DNA-binding protein [Enterococcus sp. LJL128]